MSVAFLCQLLVHTGGGGVTRMEMHAQSHAQAYLAARELFPACSVEVVALELPSRPARPYEEFRSSGAREAFSSQQQPPDP